MSSPSPSVAVAEPVGEKQNVCEMGSEEVQSPDVSKDAATLPEAKNAPVVKSATYAQLFSTADTLDWVLMAVGTLGAIVTGGCFPFINVLFGRMIDAVSSDPANFANSVKILALDFVWVSIVQIGACSTQAVCWTLAGERQTHKLRERYVRSILRQEIGFFDLNSPSQLATKVGESSGALQDGITRKASEIFQYGAQFLGSYAVGLYLCWKLALVLVTALPLIGGAGGYMVMAITTAQNSVGENYAAAGGVATESLNAIRTVNSLNMHAWVISKYRFYLSEAMQKGIRKGLDVGLGNGAIFLSFFLTYALGFYYGGSLIAEDMDRGCNPIQDDTCITGGKVIATFFSIVMGSFSIGQSAPALTAFFAAKAAALPMIEIIERQPLIDGLATGESAGVVPTEKSKGHVEIRDIVFAYPSRPNINACDNYSLDISAGETVALVGASGSGKSTIISLLLRFYDVQSGGIFLDGVDIRKLNLRWLRSIYGYVGQEPTLFAGTIFDNIAYGLDSVLLEPGKVPRDEALREKVIAAAKAANAHDFISSFPLGYDTDVGSNGVAMSGGQKQRIAIARALIKKPAVLLLDEATSALDATSERLVQESIDALQKQKAQTTIVIAHRLSTIRNADKIAVVSAGRIVELGRHEELIAKNGAYADLIRLQVEATADSTAPSGQKEDEASPSASAAPTSGDVRVRARSVSAATDKSAEGSQQRKASVDGQAPADGDAPAEPEYVVKDKAVNNKVWTLIMKHKLWFFMALLGGACFGAVFPIIGLLLSKALTAFIQPTGDEVRKQANLVAIWYLITGSGAFFAGIALFYGSAQLSERISMRLRSMLFEALLRREIGYFDKEENAIGTLTNRLSNDSRLVARASGELFAKMLQAIFTLIIGLIIGFIASWKLSLVVLATFPINAIAGTVQQQEQMGLGKKSSKDDDGSEGAIISTAFTNMRTVSAFSMHFKILEQYAEKTWVASRARQWSQSRAGLAFGVSNGITFSTYAFLFWYGSTLIKSSDIDFEQMMRALFCIMFGAMGMGAALADMGSQKEGLQAADRIFEALREAEESPIDGLSKAGETLKDRSRGCIELKNVQFAYPTRPDIEVCKGMSLRIEAGELVAFVGPSGSGKSSIMSLLLRYYDPSSGTLLLDGQDIKGINIQSLRSQIGVVSQEPCLFNMSVQDNIAKGRTQIDYSLMAIEQAIHDSDQRQIEKSPLLAKCCLSAKAEAGAAPSASTSEGYTAVGAVATDGDVELGDAKKDEASKVPIDVVQASQAANAHDFISSFPEQYNTDVGESSIMVSGGQKQRIAIARALIKKPAVLLLDEATSALDATSERLVQESIDALQKQKAQTTIVIAHRLSTIRNADKIFVIDKGSIVAMGKHDELLRDPTSLYSTLWAKQGGHASSSNLAALAGAN